MYHIPRLIFTNTANFSAVAIPSTQLNKRFSLQAFVLFGNPAAFTHDISSYFKCIYFFNMNRKRALTLDALFHTRGKEKRKERPINHGFLSTVRIASSYTANFCCPEQSVDSWREHWVTNFAAPREEWNCSCPAGFKNISSSSFFSQSKHWILLLWTSSFTLYNNKERGVHLKQNILHLSWMNNIF